MLYLIKKSLKQFFKDINITLPGFLSVVVMLFVISIFIPLLANFNYMTSSLSETCDTVEIYLKDSVSSERAQELKNILAGSSDVESAELISKDTAMTELKKSWGDDAYLLDDLATNPLPVSIRVRLKDIDKADSFTSGIKEKYEEIDDVIYPKDIISTVSELIGVVKIVCIALASILIFVSYIVIRNIIKLIIHAYSKEIEILKFVGASDFFVKCPIVLESLYIGLIAAAVSWFASHILYGHILVKYGDFISDLLSVELIPVDVVSLDMLFILLILGFVISLIAGIRSSNRYVHV